MFNFFIRYESNYAAGTYLGRKSSDSDALRPIVYTMGLGVWGRAWLRTHTWGTRRGIDKPVTLHSMTLTTSDELHLIHLDHADLYDRIPKENFYQYAV